jgi:bifunctional DNA-binding transcriptional regulator/antitoxin component of YhaV-PrlF toxin-antitoxin module
MSNVVGERYQITIDRKVREQLGVEPGDLAIERVEDGRLVVSFVPRAHRDSLLGILRQPGQEPIGDWAALMEQTRRARSAEIKAALEGGGPRRRRHVR